MTVAILFPGQGSQHVGMAKAFYEITEGKDVFQEANDILGFDITRLMLSGDEDELRLTQNAQPALLIAGIAAWRWLEAYYPDLEISAFAGHSLGEYTAMVAAGVLSFKDGLRLVRQRGEFMAAAMPAGVGGMTAVLNLPVQEIETIAHQFGVYVANDNADGQVILSGEKAKLDLAGSALKEAGAKRVLPLPVAGAFHTPLMAQASAKMGKVLETVSFKEPSEPIFLNVTAEPCEDVVEMKKVLPLQIVEPVRWREIMVALAEHGITQVFELGAGSVLTNLMKRAKLGVEAQAIIEPTEIAVEVSKIA